MPKKQKFTHTIKDNFIKVPAAVLKTDLSLAAIKVYLYLLDASDTWTPSIRQMVRDLNISDRTISKSLEELEGKGMILAERGDHKTKNRYELTRWFETPVVEITTPCRKKYDTPVVKNTTGGVVKSTTFPDEGSQMRDPDEKTIQDNYSLAEDNKGNLPTGSRKTSKELIDEELFRERWDRTLDDTFQKAKRK